jgi:hypothetical protein
MPKAKFCMTGSLLSLKCLFYSVLQHLFGSLIQATTEMTSTKLKKEFLPATMFTDPDGTGFRNMKFMFPIFNPLAYAGDKAV